MKNEYIIEKFSGLTFTKTVLLTVSYLIIHVPYFKSTQTFTASSPVCKKDEAKIVLIGLGIRQLTNPLKLFEPSL